MLSELIETKDIGQLTAERRKSLSYKDHATLANQQATDTRSPEDHTPNEMNFHKGFMRFLKKIGCLCLSRQELEDIQQPDILLKDVPKPERLSSATVAQYDKPLDQHKFEKGKQKDVPSTVGHKYPASSREGSLAEGEEKSGGLFVHGSTSSETSDNIVGGKQSNEVNGYLALTVSLEHFQKDIEQARQLGVRVIPLKADSWLLDQFSSDVLWVVTSDRNAFITQKKWNIRFTKQYEVISHAILSPYKSILAAGEARVIGGSGEYFLVDINKKSSCYQTNDHCLEIGKEAFRGANIPLLNEALESLIEQKTDGEQAQVILSVQPETLDASKQAKLIWDTLKSDPQGDGKILNDAPSNYLDKKSRKVRAQIIAELATELSSTTKDIKSLFNISIVARTRGDVAYNTRRNHLAVPVGAPLLVTVLSIIREMDRAKYEWAGARDGSEKYAQDAATAIRLIEACRKLEQPMPRDLSEDLPSLAEVYNQAYNNAQETARQHIYDWYAQKYGFERLDPPQVDARKYDLYNPQYLEDVEQIPSSEEMRWKIFQNLYPKELKDEVKTAEMLGVKPARLGDPDFDKAIEQGGGHILWVMSMSGEIIVAPASIDNNAIRHTVLAGGKPVLAAGQAEIMRSENTYILLDIDNMSGHYMPRWKLLYAIKEFSRHDIELKVS